MAKTRPQIPLGRLNKGINRFLAEEGSPDQVAEATNAVVDEGGDLHRRPAFRSVAPGPVHFLPPGQATVVAYDGVTATTYVGGRPDYTYPAAGDLYIGCTAAFDGFDWGAIVTNTAGTPSSHKRLRLRYYNGDTGTWDDIPYHLDTTVCYRPGELYSESLGREGQVHWHPRQLEGWGVSLIGSYFRFWIRITIQNVVDNQKIDPQQQWSLSAPGVRVFTREPLSTIIPAAVNSTPFVLLGADRFDNPGKSNGSSFNFYSNRNWEGGSALSAWRLDGRTPEKLDLTRRFAAGIWGQVTTFPDAVRNAVYPGGTSSAGTANTITDQCQGKEPPWQSPEQYSYSAEQPWGAELFADIDPTSGLGVTGFVSTNSNLTPLRSNYLDDYYLVCTTSGGGTPLNEVRKISYFSNGGSSVTFLVEDAFTVAPTTSTRFSIVAPPALVYITQAGRSYEPSGLAGQTTIPLEVNRTYCQHPGDALSAQVVHFEIRDQLRYVQPAGRFYTSVTDLNSGRVFLCNGSGGMLEFDGKWLRQLEAEYDSLAADTIAGSSLPVGPDGFAQDPGALPQNILRTAPPKARFITAFAGRVVVAEDHRVSWSMPLGANKIWRWGDATDFQDDTQLKLSGIATLYDRLIVFSPKAIFEGLAEGDSLTFRSTVTSVGFPSNQAVVKVPLKNGHALVSPTVGGIAGYSNGAMFDILDHWERILQGGINSARLDRSVAVHWEDKNSVLIALPSAKSTSNDTIVYWDYAREQFWVWEAPFGICSMASVTTSDGQEHILFGTDDGFVQTLVHADTDDGETITCTVRSRPEQPFEAREANFRRLNFTLSPLGAAETVTYRAYLEESDEPWCGGAFPVNTGRAVYGTSVYGTDRYAGETFKTHSVNLPSGTKAKKIQVEVEFTSPTLRLRQLWVEAGQLSTGRK